MEHINYFILAFLIILFYLFVKKVWYIQRVNSAGHTINKIIDLTSSEVYGYIKHLEDAIDREPEKYQTHLHAMNAEVASLKSFDIVDIMKASKKEFFTEEDLKFLLAYAGRLDNVRSKLKKMVSELWAVLTV